MVEKILQKIKQMFRRLTAWRRKAEPGVTAPEQAPTVEGAARPEWPPAADEPAPAPAQPLVPEEKMDQPIRVVNAPREQLENLVRELAALPEKAERLIVAGQLQAESASRVHGALTELKSYAEQGLAALSEQTQKQIEAADRIREAVTQLGDQSERGLGALSEQARKQAELLVKIHDTLDAGREPQAKMAATLERISGGIEDTSRSSSAQMEEVRRMRQSLTEASEGLSESMKAGSRRVTMLLMGILVALALLVVSVVAGVWILR